MLSICIVLLSFTGHFLEVEFSSMCSFQALEVVKLGARRATKRLTHPTSREPEGRPSQN